MSSRPQIGSVWAVDLMRQGSSASILKVLAKCVDNPVGGAERRPELEMTEKITGQGFRPIDTGKRVRTLPIDPATLKA